MYFLSCSCVVLCLVCEVKRVHVIRQQHGERGKHIFPSYSSFLPWAVCFMLSLVMSAPKNAGEKREKRKMTLDSQCLEILF